MTAEVVDFCARAGFCDVCHRPPEDKYKAITACVAGKRLVYCDRCVLGRYPSVLSFMVDVEFATDASQVRKILAEHRA